MDESKNPGRWGHGTRDQVGNRRPFQGVPAQTIPGMHKCSVELFSLLQYRRRAVEQRWGSGYRPGHCPLAPPLRKIGSALSSERKRRIPSQLSLH